MQEDKQLKKILSQLAVEDTPAAFTADIMRRIAAMDAARQYAPPLLKQKLLQVLIGAFVFVFIVLLALCIVQQPAFPFHFTIELPAAYISQIFSFLIVFWVVMLANQFISRKRGLHYK